MALPIAGILAGAGLVGKLFGGGAKGAATERANANQFQLGQDQLANQRYGIEQGARTNLSQLQEQATMNRAQLGMMAPKERMKQAILGSLIQRLQSAKVTPPAGVNMAKLSGGIDPSALLNAGARAGGGEMQRQALLALLTKSDVPGQTDYVGSGTLRPPQSGTYKTAGKGESLLSLLGLVGSAGGALGESGLIKPRGPSDTGPWA